jgi:phage protein D
MGLGPYAGMDQYLKNHPLNQKGEGLQTSHYGGNRSMNDVAADVAAGHSLMGSSVSEHNDLPPHIQQRRHSDAEFLGFQHRRHLYLDKEMKDRG